MRRLILCARRVHCSRERTALRLPACLDGSLHGDPPRSLYKKPARARGSQTCCKGAPANRPGCCCCCVSSPPRASNLLVVAAAVVIPRAGAAGVPQAQTDGQPSRDPWSTAPAGRDEDDSGWAPAKSRFLLRLCFARPIRKPRVSAGSSSLLSAPHQPGVRSAPKTQHSAAAAPSGAAVPPSRQAQRDEPRGLAAARLEDLVAFGSFPHAGGEQQRPMVVSALRDALLLLCCARRARRRAETSLCKGGREGSQRCLRSPARPRREGTNLPGKPSWWSSSQRASRRAPALPEVAHACGAPPPPSRCWKAAAGGPLQRLAGLPSAPFWQARKWSCPPAPSCQSKRPGWIWGVDTNGLLYNPALEKSH